FAMLAILGVLANNRSSLLLAAVLPLVRTDFVILSGLITCFEFARGSRGIAVASLVTAAICYLAVNHLAGNYGYLTIFNFSFIEMDPYPAGLVPSTHLPSYLRPYGSALLQVLIDT